MATSRSLLWLMVVAAALVGGAVVPGISTAYIWSFLALAFVVAIFLWRSQAPMVPFLLLVAAIQGGVLLQLPLGNAPINTLMPFLGGWTVVAVLVGRESNHLTRPAGDHGKLLSRALVALAMVVALTAIAQNWRTGGRLLQLSEVLTLVQLGVLVVLVAYLLSSPSRVLWVAYVTIAAGAATAVVALADRAGLVTVGTELVYSEGYTRVSGLSNDPNFFSFQLLIALAFAVHLALAARTILGKVMVWSAFAVIFAGIVSSYSAGALVGVGAVLGATILLQFRVSAKRALAAFVLIAAATAVVAAAAPPGYGQAVKAKYMGITSTPFEQVGTKRGAAWEAGLREMGSNPVMGVGLSTQNQESAIAEYYTLSRSERRAAHNMYLSIGVGSGVFGLAAFLVILASCFSVLWTAYSKAARERRSETALAVACVFTALVVVATQGLQLDLQLEKFTWLLVGACVAIRHWSIEPRHDPPVAS